MPKVMAYSRSLVIAILSPFCVVSLDILISNSNLYPG